MAAMNRRRFLARVPLDLDTLLEATGADPLSPEWI
jgi:hypothetical protein